jgi:serine/threonine protein kinase
MTPEDQTRIEQPGGTGSRTGGSDAQAQPPAPVLVAGEVLADRFRIVRFLGRGGMGAVYEADDLLLPDRVALKTISTPDATQDASLERFRQEIYLARQITHPNICRVHDVFTHHPAAGPSLFLSMELLRGETLAERLRRAAPVQLGELRAIARQVCLALAAMHRAHVVHRDLKSSNVMLVPDEREPSGLRAVVMDFGLARHSLVVESTGLTDDARLLSLGTSAYVTAATGKFVGTPAYLAPEQVEGGPIGAWTDIYAFGVVLFEAACGRLPFRGATSVDTAFQRLTQPPPEPRALVPTLPPGWRHIILRCLERSPDRRFASADEILDALEKLPAAGEGSPTASRVALNARTVALALALMITVTGGLAVLPYIRLGTREAVSTKEPAASDVITATLLRLAGNALVRGDHRSAYEALREAWDANPDDPEVRRRVAELWSSVEGELTRLGRLAGASDDPKAAAAIAEGKKLAEGGRSLDGVASLLRAHAQMVREPPRAGDPPPSSPPDALPDGPRRPSQEGLARRVLQSGRDFLRDRKYTEAINDFQFVLDRFPTTSVADDALLEIAVYESTVGGNPQRAREAADRLLARYPDSAAALATRLREAREARRRMAVRISGEYRFEVRGCGTVSPPAETHLLQVTSPCSLQLLAPDYWLNKADYEVMEGTGGEVAYRAPPLVNVQLRSRFVDCTLLLGDRAIGSPPVSVQVAAGVHSVAVQCRDQTLRTRPFQISPVDTFRNIDEFIR